MLLKFQFWSPKALCDPIRRKSLGNQARCGHWAWPMSGLVSLQNKKQKGANTARGFAHLAQLPPQCPAPCEDTVRRQDLRRNWICQHLDLAQSYNKQINMYTYIHMCAPVTTPHIIVYCTTTIGLHYSGLSIPFPSHNWKEPAMWPSSWAHAFHVWGPEFNAGGCLGEGGFRERGRQRAGGHALPTQETKFNPWHCKAQY